MKKLIFFLFIILIAQAGCTKVEKTRTSGTETIDNTTYMSTTYYVWGFTFSTAKLVSTNSNPGPDITIYVNTDNPGVPSRLYLLANNLMPSFYKVGDYADESAAKSAFDNLKSISVPQWADLADPINPNQIWIYRSGNEKYTKFRIIRTVNEVRQFIPYGECTFEWVHQPDGSLTFP